MFNSNHYHPLKRNGAAARIVGVLVVSLLLAPLLIAYRPREPLSDAVIRQQLEASFEQQAQDRYCSGTVLIARDGVPMVARA